MPLRTSKTMLLCIAVGALGSLGACGGVAASAGTVTTDPNTGPIEGRPPNNARCPADQPGAGATCIEAGLGCAYREGGCRCAVPPVCSGVPRAPDPTVAPVWECRIVTPQCPSEPPSGACSADGVRCPYSMGGCASMTASCIGGAWRIDAYGPPPSTPSSGASPSTTTTTTPTPTTDLADAPVSADLTEAHDSSDAEPEAVPLPRRPTCPRATRFGCTNESTGSAPERDEEPPRVCGCIPRCHAPERFLVALSTGELYRDGSRVGRFACATGGIPSARPPEGVE